jgi:hypothetical protein
MRPGHGECRKQQTNSFSRSLDLFGALRQPTRRYKQNIPGRDSLVGKTIFRGRTRVKEVGLLQFGTLFVGGIGIGVALVNQRRQLNAQMFIEFSKRFEELLRLFPTEAWLANRRPDQVLPPPSKEITECTLYCLQFVNDVYHLHKAGYISNSLWRLWEREIKRTLRGPLFVREWSAVAPEFSHDKDFLDYMGK